MKDSSGWSTTPIPSGGTGRKEPRLVHPQPPPLPGSLPHVRTMYKEPSPRVLRLARRLPSLAGRPAPPPHFSHPRLAAALPRAMPPLQQRPMLCRPVQIHTCLHRMWRGASHERLPSCPLGTTRKSSFPAEGPTTWLPTARLPPAQPADAEPSYVKTST